MKPSRSKREGRADRAREIQRGRRGARRGPAPPTPGGGARGRLRARPRALLPCAAPATGGVGPAEAGRLGFLRPSRSPDGGPVGEPRDRPWSRRPPGRGRNDGPRLAARSSPLARGLRAGGEGGLRRRAGPPGPPVEPRPPRPFPVAAGRRFPDGAGVGRARAPRVRGRLPRALPTRLETRTKESIGPASRGDESEAPRRSESEGRPAGRPRRDPAARRPAHRRPAASPPRLRRRESGHARTRKMVNYARAGRSQRKLWWRSAAILTCKSIVRLGYRGERLIEPSSSWFPPKFPSG